MQKYALSYCGDLVRTYDADRFLLALFCPPEVREDIFALFAFHCEIAKTREVVSENTLGLIRLQWWRDEIDRIYCGAEPSAHEVLRPLAQAIQKHNLPKEHFETLIYAREFDLEDVLPGNLEGLLNYADFTTTPLFKLALQIMGDDPDVLVVQPVAVNYTLASILKAIPAHARQGRCYLPEDMLKAQGVRKEDIINYEAGEKIKPVIQGITKAQVKGIKQKNCLLRAADTLADINFSNIKSLKYNVFSQKSALPPPFKVLRLWFRTKFI